MDAFVAKPFSLHRCPEIAHSGTKHKFCIFLQAKGLRNAQKHSQTSICVKWSIIDAFVAKPVSHFRYPEIVHSPETQVLHLFTCRRFGKCSGTLPNVVFGLMVLNGCFCCETIFAASVPRNRAFRPQRQGLLLFTCRRFAKCSGTLPNINFGLIV